MKAYYYLIFVVLFITSSIVIMTGCEYDVSSPLWEQDFENPPTPQITQIEPSQGASAGVNFITIYGENFLGVPDTNGVFFDNVPAEIVSNSPSTIVVRRPNLANDACTIKIVPTQTLVVVKYSPYRIDPVMERYGSFLENLQLSVVAVDNNENVYVVETVTRNIIKVTPDGEKTTIGVTTRPPYDARFGPDGRLYLPENNRAIDVADPQTGEVSQWTRLPSGQVVRYLDFDANGYCYTGGRRSQLVVIDPNLISKQTGFYASDEIFGIRVYQGYVYLAVSIASPDEQNPALAIWRHAIDGSGNVGNPELVYDLTLKEDFASRNINSINFSENGTLYIGTDAPDPLLVVDPSTSNSDYFYKSILPSYSKHFYWGTGTFIYMICGNPTLGEEWTVYRINMGANGAPPYGG